MLINILLLLVGLGLILFGANYLVEGSSSIARRFGISEFVVGLTIVGIGTSTPEMVVSFISSFEGSCDIAMGNIVGSNIANVFLILGLTAIIAPIALTKNNVRKDIPFAIFVSVLLFLMSYDSLLWGKESNVLSRVDGVILLILFVLFMIYSFKTPPPAEELAQSDSNENNIEGKEKPKVAIAAVKILAGLATLIFGGKLFVNSGKEIASAAGMSEAYIGITIMALGTSLPELAASVVAAIKKKGQMALGNIIGSNVSNILLILGGSSLIHPLTLGNITILDFAVMIATTVLLLPCAFTFKKNYIDRWEGLIFFIIYVAYITYLTTQL